MKKIPCRNCITLPVCKGLLSSGKMINVRVLSRKCSIFNQWITGGNKLFIISLEHEQEFRDVFSNAKKENIWWS